MPENRILPNNIKINKKGGSVAENMLRNCGAMKWGGYLGGSMAKATIYVFIYMLILATNVIAADFNKSTWGDSKKKVKQTFKVKPLKETDNSLFYEDTLASMKVYAFYKFENNKLVGGMYTNGSRHTNLNDFIDDYSKLKDLLGKKYGKPDVDNIEWKQSLYEDDPEHWGIAIAMGQLEYSEAWNTERSRIYHSLEGDEFKVQHSIFYAEIFNFKKSSEKAEKKNLDQL